MPGGFVNSTIDIAGADTVYDVNVFVDITHPFSSDIQVNLISPSGTVVTLLSNHPGINFGNTSNLFAGTVFDDDADPGGQVPYQTNQFLATDRQYSNNVVAALLVPVDALGAFIGENPNGTWTLRVADVRNSNAGTINSWSLTIQTAPAASAPIPTRPASTSRRRQRSSRETRTRAARPTRSLPTERRGRTWPGSWVTGTGTGRYGRCL